MLRILYTIRHGAPCLYQYPDKLQPQAQAFTQVLSIQATDTASDQDGQQSRVTDNGQGLQANGQTAAGKGQGLRMTTGAKVKAKQTGKGARINKGGNNQTTGQGWESIKGVTLARIQPDKMNLRIILKCLSGC